VWIRFENIRYMHWYQIHCFKNNLQYATKTAGFVYASVGSNIKGLLVHITIMDFVSAIGA
jgi:hypothetical protein